MSLQAYMDDSREGGDVLVIAGYYASPDDWLKFSAEWQDYLKFYAPIEAFKMSDYSRTFQSVEAWERLKFMHQCIERYTIGSIRCVIETRDYHYACLRAGYHSGPDGPQHMIMAYLMNELHNDLELMGKTVPFDFIFDQQLHVMDLTMESYVLYKKGREDNNRKLICKPPVFGDDRKFLPIQAADLLSWWVRKQYLETGDLSRHVVFSHPDHSDRWTEDKSKEKIFLNPTKEDLAERMIRYAAHFDESEVKELLSERAKRRYKPGTFKSHPGAK